MHAHEPRLYAADSTGGGAHSNNVRRDMHALVACDQTGGMKNLQAVWGQPAAGAGGPGGGRLAQRRVTTATGSSDRAPNLKPETLKPETLGPLQLVASKLT